MKKIRVCSALCSMVLLLAGCSGGDKEASNAGPAQASQKNPPVQQAKQAPKTKPDPGKAAPQPKLDQERRSPLAKVRKNLQQKGNPTGIAAKPKPAGIRRNRRRREDDDDRGRGLFSKMKQIKPAGKKKPVAKSRSRQRRDEEEEERRGLFSRAGKKRIFSRGADRRLGAGRFNNYYSGEGIAAIKPVGPPDVTSRQAGLAMFTVLLVQRVQKRIGKDRQIRQTRLDRIAQEARKKAAAERRENRRGGRRSRDDDGPFIGRKGKTKRRSGFGLFNFGSKGDKDGSSTRQRRKKSSGRRSGTKSKNSKTKKRRRNPFSRRD